MSLTQKTIQNVGIAYSTVIFTRLVGIFSIVILARLLTPSDFGLVGISAIVIGIISIMQDFGLSNALIQRKNNVSEAADIVFFSTILINSLLYIVAFAVAPIAAEFFKDTSITAIIRIASLSLIIDAFGAVHSGLLTKYLYFKKIAFVTISKNIFGIGSSIFFAILGFSYWSLVYGNLVLSLSNVILLWFISDWRPKFRINYQVAREMFSYGKNVIAIISLTFGIKNIDNFVIGRILGAESLGVYSLAYKFGMFSATNISSTLSSVMFPTYSLLQDKKEAIEKAYIKTLRFISLIAMPLSFSTIILAPEFILYILGQKWMEVILPLQILSIAGLFASLGGPSWNIFLAVGKPSISSKVAIIEFILIIILIYPSSLLYGLHGVAAVILISFATGTMYSFYKIKKVLNLSSYKKILSEISNPLFSSIIMVFVLIILKMSAVSSFFIFILLIFMGLASYTLSIYFMTKGEIISDINTMWQSITKKNRD